MNRHFGCVAALLFGVLAAAPLHAQHVSARIGAGPALAGSLGGAGIVGVQWQRSRVILRAEGSAVGTGRTGDWENSSRVITLGGGLGVATGSVAARTGTWVLGRVATGFDPREGDQLTAFGASLGVERDGRAALFGELRLDYWNQRGSRHYELPELVTALVAGIVVRAR